MYGWNGAWGHGVCGFGFPWGGMGMGILFIAIVVVAVVFAVRLGRSGRFPNGSPRDRGMEILVERFSRGEIDSETFRSMKADLESK